MTKTTTANYLSIAAPGNSFNARISADSDIFARNDIDALGDALDLHDHTSGKGLAVGALAGTVTLAGATSITGAGVTIATGPLTVSANGLTVTAGANNLGTGLTQYTTYAVRAFNSLAISITSSAVTALTFDSERYDTAAMHDTVTNTGRLTAPVAGKYRITGHVVFSPSAGGTFRYVSIRVNGATTIAAQSNPSLGAAVSPELTVATTYSLAATDYVELVVQHDAGVNINASALSNYSPEFEMEYTGA